MDESNVNEDMELFCKFYFFIVMDIIKDDDYAVLQHCSDMEYYIVQYPKLLMQLEQCEKEYYIIDEYVNFGIDNEDTLKLFNGLEYIMMYISDLKKEMKFSVSALMYINNKDLYNNNYNRKFLLFCAKYDCCVRLHSGMCNKISDKLLSFYNQYFENH